MTSQPTILRSSTGADFLAMLPALAGYTARNSIVVVPFSGKRTVGVIRMDLPRTSDPRIDARVGATAVGMLSRLDDCDGVIFAFYTDEAFTVARMRREALWYRLDDRFEAAGFRVKDAFCVAADGWASWYDDETPLDGHPLSRITESPMVQKAAATLHRNDLEEFDAGAALPEADPTLAALLATAVSDLIEDGVERTGLGLSVPAERIRPAEFIEELMKVDPDNASVRQLARLVALTTIPVERDLAILQIAFGRKQVRRIERTASRDGHDESTLRLFVGDTTKIPSRKRIAKTVALLRRAIPNIDVIDVPGPLSVLAWMCWALGRASVAGAHVDRTLALDPRNELAVVVHHQVRAQRIPDWVYAAHGRALRRARTGMP